MPQRLDVSLPSQGNGAIEPVTNCDRFPEASGPAILPFAFTEQGVAMLSSVVRNERAVQANIEIMRTFVRLRQLLAINADLAHRLDESERRVGGHDEQFAHVIRAIRQLMEPPAALKMRRIGFHAGDESSSDEDANPT